MIKFRAYCDNCKKYTYFNDEDHYFFNTLGEMEAICKNGDNDWGDFEHQLNNLEQFTGLQDKNGKDIYVGDIVKFWEENNFGEDYLSTIIIESIFDYNNLMHINYGRAVEVIGNINENAELLKTD